MGRHLRRLALWVAPLAFVGVLFYWPLANILPLGLGQNWLTVLGAAQVQATIWFTIWQATLSTALSVLIGLPVAFVLYKRRFFGSKLLRTILVIPFVLPSIVVAFALSDLRDFFVGGEILVILIAHVFLNLSLVVRIVGNAYGQLDPELEGAAELDGAAGLKLFFGVTLPQLRPALVSAATLVFLFCVTSFAAILLLGAGRLNSIETLIYFSLNQRLDLTTAAALSLVQTALTVLAFLTSRKLGAAQFNAESEFEDSQPKALQRRELPLLAAVLAVLITLFVIPLGTVLLRSFTVDGRPSLAHFELLATQGARNLLDITVFEAGLNSLRNAGIATMIALPIGVLIAWLLKRSRSGWLELAFVLPLGVSTVVLGFGYLISFGGQPLPLRQSWLVVPLVQALIAMPMVIRIVHSRLIALGSAAEEAAANAGASTWQTFRLIELPQISSSIATALGFALLVSIGEFGSSALLAYGDQATLPIALMRLISRPGEQNYAMAMATSALLITLVFVLVSTTELIRSRRSIRRDVY